NPLISVVSTFFASSFPLLHATKNTETSVKITAAFVLILLFPLIYPSLIINYCQYFIHTNSWLFYAFMNLALIATIMVLWGNHHSWVIKYRKCLSVYMCCNSDYLNIVV